MARGQCKLCSSAHRDAINALIAQGKNEAQTKRVIREIDPQFTWTRQTFYTHQDHITHPLVTYADEARHSPVVVPKTNIGALEMIRDIGMRRAVEHPSEVTIDHALKAADTLEKKRDVRGSVWVILAKALNHQLPEEIQGEFTVLPSAEEEGEIV